MGTSREKWKIDSSHSLSASEPVPTKGKPIIPIEDD